MRRRLQRRPQQGPLVGLNNGNASFAARGTGDRIFVFSGTYNHGHTFAANERLIGQGSSAIQTSLGLDFSPYTNGTLDTLPSTGVAPTLQNTVTAATEALCAASPSAPAPTRATSAAARPVWPCSRRR